MRKQFHILNGDSLKEQFPKAIKGSIIVVRECLIEGSLAGSTHDEFFATRAKFLNQGGISEKEYYENSVSEFQKIIKIDKNSDINLWFEDDLFCQVNLWFVVSLIKDNYKDQSVFLVRPKEEFKYNFGGMNEEELISAYENKVQIDLSELKILGKLWNFYRQDACAEMLNEADELNGKYPFLKDAIKAHKERLPQEGNPGRPIQTLIQIMNDLNTSDFWTIFREFNNREAIYGFGDSQVKRLLNEAAKFL